MPNDAKFIPLSEWLPDLAPTIGDQDAINVVPVADGYVPWNAQMVYSNTLSARVQGFIAAQDSSGVNYNYCGDNDGLWVLGDQTWTSATRTTSASYSTASTGYWEFVQWNQTVIGTNYGDEPQQISLGGGHFANLPGAPPQAKHIAIVKDFVVLGNIPSFPQRVQWSAINNSNSWTVDATTQADYQDLVGGGGAVQKIIGGEYGIVFQERSIWRQTYVGSPIIFQFDAVEKNIGVLAPQSVVNYGTFVFYLSEEGFKIFNGSVSEDIGVNKINKTFFNDLDPAYIDRVNAIIDPVQSLYLVAYPGSGNVSGTPNKILAYNWAIRRWSSISDETELLVRHIATGYTMDGLDTVTTNLDTLPATLDSYLWVGGQINLAAFDKNHALALFTGSVRDGLVTTREIQHTPGRRTNVFRLRPFVDGATASVQVGSRNLTSEAVTYGTGIAQNATGDCCVRSNARYHRYRINTSGDFDLIRGVVLLDYSPGGTR